MDALIRVKPDELKEGLITMLKGLVQGNENLEIIIQVKEKLNLSVVEESPSEYFAQLKKSIEDRLKGRTVSFTMDEFEKYVKDNFSE